MMQNPQSIAAACGCNSLQAGMVHENTEPTATQRCARMDSKTKRHWMPQTQLGCCKCWSRAPAAPGPRKDTPPARRARPEGTRAASTQDPEHPGARKAARESWLCNLAHMVTRIWSASFDLPSNGHEEWTTYSSQYVPQSLQKASRGGQMEPPSAMAPIPKKLGQNHQSWRFRK